LDLSQNLLVSISAILPQNLISFKVAHNRIKNLEGIEQLKSLVVFDFSFNQVSEIKEIARLKGSLALKELNAEGNPIERERNLELYRNEVKQ
jgi:Leucine-rich repeat (LRR) protein